MENDSEKEEVKLSTDLQVEQLLKKIQPFIASALLGKKTYVCYKTMVILISGFAVSIGVKPDIFISDILDVFRASNELKNKRRKSWKIMKKIRKLWKSIKN